MTSANEIIHDRDRGTYAASVAEAIAAEKIAKGSKLNLPLPLGKMLRCDTLTQLIDQCGETAEGHGFWTAHVDTALKHAKIDPLVYEAFISVRVRGSGTQAQRDLLQDEKTVQRCAAIYALKEAELLGDPAIFLALIGTETAEAIEAARNGNWTKPSGVWEELADVAIRLFDFVARYSSKHEMTPEKFVQLIQAKMAVNEARPPKHGKNY